MTALPPYPSKDLDRWALDIVEYLIQRDNPTEQTMPAPVALAHKVGGERALQDGLVLFDPSLGKAVISIGGVWRSFTLDP